MANVWMHNGFLQVEGEKMSKSLGNFITIHELRTGWKGEPWAGAAIRYAMLGAHYRQPIDWTLDRLAEAKANVYSMASYSAKQYFNDENAYARAWRGDALPSPEVLEALEDDLNTPEALSHVSGAISRILTLKDDERVRLVHDMRFLGLMEEAQRPSLTGTMTISNAPEELVDEASLKFRDYQVGRANVDVQFSGTAKTWLDDHKFFMTSENTLSYQTTNTARGYIERLLDERHAARSRKDWKESDRLRHELAKIGVVLKDNKDGTTSWEVRR